MSTYKKVSIEGVTGVLGRAETGLFGCGNAEIIHHFGGMRIVYLFRTLADSENNQFVFADLRK